MFEIGIGNVDRNLFGKIVIRCNDEEIDWINFIIVE